MMKITCYEGLEKDVLKDFEEEQWPLADKEHFGDSSPDFHKRRFTVIAREGENIVGFIYMLTDMGVATIESILVHNEARRKGIASEMLKEAETKALEERCHLIRLETGKDWGARKLYEAGGYVVRAVLEEYYGKKDFILMEKRL